MACDGLLPGDQLWTSADIHTELAMRNVALFVARPASRACTGAQPDDTCRLAGFLFVKFSSLAIHVANLTVMPAQRRKGVATMLLQACTPGVNMRLMLMHRMHPLACDGTC
eukprot:353445-Chlamydomonas_euryale.AAC.16